MTDRGPVVNQSPREANIDGMLHATVDHPSASCDCRDKCRTCGARSHSQALHDGMTYLCEECSADANEWMPVGTYKHDDGTVTR